MSPKIHLLAPSEAKRLGSDNVLAKSAELGTPIEVRGLTEGMTWVVVTIAYAIFEILWLCLWPKWAYMRDMLTPFSIFKETKIFIKRINFSKICPIYPSKVIPPIGRLPCPQRRTSTKSWGQGSKTFNTEWNSQLVVVLMAFDAIDQFNGTEAAVFKK